MSTPIATVCSVLVPARSTGEATYLAMDQVLLEPVQAFESPKKAVAGADVELLQGLADGVRLFVRVSEHPSDTWKSRP